MRPERPMATMTREAKSATYWKKRRIRVPASSDAISPPRRDTARTIRLITAPRMMRVNRLDIATSLGCIDKAAKACRR